MHRLCKRPSEKKFLGGDLVMSKRIKKDTNRVMKEDKLKRFETKSTEYLREEGVYGEVEASAMKQAIAAALAQRMERQGMSITELAAALGTSRAAVNRILDPLNTSLTLTSLARAAAALGCRVRIEIVNPK